MSRPITPLETALGDNLGEYVKRDKELLKVKGWNRLVQEHRGRGDFLELNINHPAQELLKKYKSQGVPVKCHTQVWTKGMLDRAIRRGTHKLCYNYMDFLEVEFKDMISKGQWMVLSYKAVKGFKGLRLSPPGMVPQRERRPRWIVDYSW